MNQLHQELSLSTDRHPRNRSVLLVSGLALSAALLNGCGQGERSTEAAASEGNTVQFGDVALHVRSLGNPDAEEVLIAAHGGPGLSHESLNALTGLAGPNRRVVLYDQRGAGLSERPVDGDYSIASQVQDLKEVQEWTGATTVDLLGKSWGGLLVSAYTAEYPDNVDELVLVAAIPLDTEEFLAGQARFMDRVEDLQENGMVPDPLPERTENSCAEQLRAVIPAYLSDPRSEQPTVASCSPEPSVAFDEVVDARIMQSYRDKLSEFTGRTLVVMGEDDPFGIGWADKTIGTLGAAETERLIVKDAGHFPLEEQPGTLSKINDFIE